MDHFIWGDGVYCIQCSYFLGQRLMGKSGIMTASIAEALMPMLSIVILWGYKHVKPKKYTMISILIAFLGASMVITKGNISFFFH